MEEVLLELHLVEVVRVEQMAVVEHQELPTQGVAVAAAVQITRLAELLVKAAPVSLSSKSHLRTMPHSHLV
jgi:hypothetical protein